jgi:CHAD domain-containing protein
VTSGVVVALRRGGGAPPGRLAPGEPAGAGLLRLLRAEVATARGELAAERDAPSETAVHGVRKRLKMARTMARLLRAPLGDRADEVSGALREAAQALGALRDAAVTAGTAGTLATRLKPGSERVVLARIGAEAAGAAKGRRADVGRAEAALAEAARALEPVRLGPAADADVHAAAARVYARARRAFRAARADPSIEGLHEWRKRVKDRLHAARLFAERWPERRARDEPRLDRLGDLLGRDHDYAVLAERLPERSGAARRVAARLERKREKLHRRAFKLGARLFGEKPRRVRRAWTGAPHLAR